MNRAHSRIPIAPLAFLVACGVTVAAELPLKLEEPVTGRTVMIDAEAKATHVVFFATWCPPCREEIEDLADGEARWGERGYRLVLVAVQNRHTSERLAQFVRERRPPGIFLFDRDGKVQKKWGAEHLPTHVLFDAAGREVMRSGGFDEGLREAIDALVASKKSGP